MLVQFKLRAEARFEMLLLQKRMQACRQVCACNFANTSWDSNTQSSDWKSDALRIRPRRLDRLPLLANPKIGHWIEIKERRRVEGF